ncbi:hypothetical protein G7Y79_00034g069750 [Physcia stellaris]|nr:hypothetical protein G7Y79_00034g069750 [Physcia stellaris]
METAFDRAAVYRKYCGALDYAQREIRLLRVHHSDNQEVVCDISTVSLNEPPAYLALSYVWGDPSDTKPLVLGGRDFPVTANLKAALMIISRQAPVEGTMLWADAVCINQADMEEKSRQVNIMGEIYRQATETIVWLGPEESESKKAVGALKRMSDWIIEQYNKKDPGLLAWMLRNIADPSYMKRLIDGLDFGFEINHEIPLEPITALFERPWWKRVWTIQEVALSSQVYILCGSERMPWEVLENVATVLTMKLGFSPPLDHFTMKNILEILSLRWHYRQLHLDDKATLSRISLIDLISMSRIAGYKCTDPRDYVFGMLGMTEDAIAKRITVDYEKSTVRTVFMHVAKLSLETYGLKVFSHCFLEPQPGLTSTVEDRYIKDDAAEAVKSHSSKETHQQVLGTDPSHPDSITTSFRIPSWVPRWSNSRSQLESTTQDLDGKPFKGASLSLPDVKPLLEFGSHDTLLLKGVFLDQVARTYAMPYERPTLNDWFQELALMIQDSSVYLSEEQKRNALWRTPCANVISEAVRLGRTATQADGRFIDVLLTHKATETAEIQYSKDSSAIPGTGKEHVKSRLRLAWSFPKPEMFEELEVCMRDYAFSIFSLDWKIYITRKGYLGLGPISTETGDQICIFPTAEKPHILRNVDDRGRHLLVGETYVHGLMNGELQASEMQPITLI